MSAIKAAAAAGREAATGGTVDRQQRRQIERYVASLPADAPLRAIVAASPFTSVLAAYEAVNHSALAAQTHARRSGRTWLAAATLGTIIGAILLTPLSGLPKALGALQTLALAVSLVALWWISRRKPVDRWMVTRAEAERLRRQLFETLIEAPTPAGADATTTLTQKLGCFVAAHLDYQRAFFESSAVKDRAAASQTTPLKLTSYAIFAVAMLFGATVLIQAAAERYAVPPNLVALASLVAVADANRWQLALSAIASSLLTYVGARADMDQNERNASRYEATAQLIAKLKETRLPMAQQAAARGDIEGVRAFTREVQTVLAHEHLAWFLSQDPQDERIAAHQSDLPVAIDPARTSRLQAASGERPLT
jgi:hypothetical protein